MTKERYISLFVFSLTYSEDKDGLVLILFGRDEDNKRRIIRVRGTTPHFYTPEKPNFSDEYLERVVKVSRSTVPAIDGCYPWKIETRLPRDVGQLRKFFSKTYQADVIYTDKCRYDLGIKEFIRIPDRDEIHQDEIVPLRENEKRPEIKPNYVIIDIEVDDRQGFSSRENPVGEFLCVSFYSPKHDRYYLLHQLEIDHDKVVAHIKDYLESNPDMNEYLKNDVVRIINTHGHHDNQALRYFQSVDEVGMLQTIPKMLHKLETDIIGGWWVDGFDIPVIMGRMKEMRVNPARLSEIGRIDARGGRRPIVGIPILDTMGGWKKLLKGLPESSKLDFVANSELKAGKLSTFPNGFGWEYFEGDRELIAAYNVIDVALTKAINDKMNVLFYHMAVVNTAGTDIEECFYNSKLLDSYIFHKLWNKMILPTQVRGEEREEKFKGATVFEPPVGLHENVVVVDLNSLYPNIIIGCDIDPTTIISDGEPLPDDYITTPSGHMFRKDKEGIIPTILIEMIEKRKVYKNARDENVPGTDLYNTYELMQFSFKTLTNAFYGVLGFIGFRLMDVRCGEATTSVGRSIINYSAEKIESLGYNVLYADTDSLFVTDPAKSDMTLDELISMGYEIAEYLNTTYDEFAEMLNISPGKHRFRIGFEKIYKRLFFSVKKSGEGIKKKYGGRLVFKK